MTHQIQILHEQDGEDVVNSLYKPLSDAGYEVLHNSTLEIGESFVESYLKNLEDGCPIVFCGTKKAVGTELLRSVANAARRKGSKIFFLQIERGAAVDSLTLDEFVFRYWKNPTEAINSLLKELNRHYPVFEADPASKGIGKQGRQHAPVPTKFEDVPPLLPYLCNRESELNLLSRLLRQRSSGLPFICVTFGEWNEAHGKFFDRLKEVFLRVEQEISKKQAIENISISWPKVIYNSNFEEDLWHQIASGMGLRRGASKDEIVNKLTNKFSQSPIVMLKVQREFRDWTAKVESECKAFLQFWDTFPDLQSSRLLFVFLGLVHKPFLIERKRPSIFNVFNWALQALYRSQERFTARPRKSWDSHLSLREIASLELSAISRQEALDFANNIETIYDEYYKHCDYRKPTIPRLYFKLEALRREFDAFYDRPELLKREDAIAMSLLGEQMYPVLQTNSSRLPFSTR